MRKAAWVEAIRLTPETFNDVCDFIGEDKLDDGTFQQECFIDFRGDDDAPYAVFAANWVIKLDGTLSVVTDDFFHKNYEIYYLEEPTIQQPVSKEELGDAVMKEEKPEVKSGT